VSRKKCSFLFFYVDKVFFMLYLKIVNFKKKENKLKELLTQKELLEKLKIERTKLWKLRKEGMPHYISPLRFDYEKVLEWLDKRQAEK